MLAQLGAGRIADFRMIIRGQQRTTHSNSEKVSGVQKNYATTLLFLRYHRAGQAYRRLEHPPEDTQKRAAHFVLTRLICASFPYSPRVRSAE